MKKTILTLAGCGLCLALYFALKEAPATPATEQVSDSTEVVTPRATQKSNSTNRLAQLNKPLTKIAPRETPKNLAEEIIAGEEDDMNPDARRLLDNDERAMKDGYGTTPAISERNAQVKSVIEALNNKSHPERLSPIISPKAFDPIKFKNDKDFRTNYINTAEPGRALQSLTPGEGIPKTIRQNSYLREVTQGEKITLTIKTASNSVATFTSFDLGKFGNGLTTQTVTSDSQGFASVDFYGMPGTISATSVLASSPEAAGQAKFKIHTLLKQKKEK